LAYFWESTRLWREQASENPAIRPNKRRVNESKKDSGRMLAMDWPVKWIPPTGGMEKFFTIQTDHRHVPETSESEGRRPERLRDHLKASYISLSMGSAENLRRTPEGLSVNSSHCSASLLTERTTPEKARRSRFQ